MSDPDVVVAGFGPTGVTLSALLGQRGIRVAAFDKLPDLYPKPRAIAFDHETMRVLQELGITDRVLPHTAPYRPSEYRGMSGQLIKRLDMAPPPYALGWAPNYVFNQPAVEAILRERARELHTVTACYPAEVLDFVQQDDAVDVGVRFEDGHEETVRTRFLIACDGGSSPLRKRLGIELEDLEFDEPWLVVDARVNADKLLELPQTQVQYCEAGRPCTFVVGPGNHRRWEIMLLPGESLSSEFPEAELWPLLARWIGPADARLWRAATYRFHGLVARRWRCGRVLLAGDAAHMTPPFMAQGMVQGIRDAQNLAWKIERVLRWDAPESLLDSYGVERRPHVIATTNIALGLGRVICERDPVKARARDVRMIADQGGEVRTEIRQNLIPGLMPGPLLTDTPGAGTLFPQPRVRDDTSFSGLLDDLTGAEIVVVTVATLDQDDITLLSGSLSAIRGRLIVLSREPSSRMVEEQPLIEPWLESLQRRFAVVRPDHYVFGTAADLVECLDLLKRLTAALTTMKQ